jgi:hypothetical protein
MPGESQENQRNHANDGAYPESLHREIVDIGTTLD